MYLCSQVKLVSQTGQLLLIGAFPANDQLEILPFEQRHGSQKHIQAFFPINPANEEEDGFLGIDPISSPPD